jgi:hypothetical protein
MILTIENYNLDSKIPYSDSIYSMCEHYITELGIGNYECMLSVVLHDTDNLEGMWGYCDWDPMEQLSEVHIAMKGPAWGITLAHEMVHVKQNLQYGVTSEGPAYELEYELYNSWQAENEPTR